MRGSSLIGSNLWMFRSVVVKDGLTIGSRLCALFVLENIHCIEIIYENVCNACLFSKKLFSY